MKQRQITYVLDSLPDIVSNDDLETAIWAGDVDRLQEIAGCICCCADHTHEGCAARLWGGCRGQDSTTRDDEESWARHYETFHGMDRDVFFGVEARDS